MELIIISRKLGFFAGMCHIDLICIISVKTLYFTKLKINFSHLLFFFFLFEYISVLQNKIFHVSDQVFLTAVHYNLQQKRIQNQKFEFLTCSLYHQFMPDKFFKKAYISNFSQLAARRDAALPSFLLHLSLYSNSTTVYICRCTTKP